jgi:hypothetical protein
MKITKIFCLGMLLLAASACSGTLPFMGSAQVFPPIEAGKGRVFFYRTSVLGDAYTPDVLLNGEKVGKLDRRGVLYRDVTPGSYGVTTSSTSRVANFSIAAGEKRYVRFNSEFFEAYIHPQLIEPAKGEADMAGLTLLAPARK